MIDFFEFLNTCSPLRTICYLIFIGAIVRIFFYGITDIIKGLRGSVINNHYYNYNEIDVEDTDNNLEVETNG